jgi:hypothetical protein
MVRPFEPTPEQSAAVAEIRRTREARAAQLLGIEARVRAQVAEEKKTLDMNYARAIRKALSMGVAKNYIGSVGMGTRDPHTVNNWLAKTEDAAPTAFEVFMDQGAGMVRVDYPGFPTSSTAEDYPHALSGVVLRDESAPNGWVVVDDPTDQPYGDHVLPGFLRWEITEVPRGVPGSLTSLLDAWVESR